MNHQSAQRPAPSATFYPFKLTQKAKTLNLTCGRWGTQTELLAKLVTLMRMDAIVANSPLLLEGEPTEELFFIKSGTGTAAALIAWGLLNKRNLSPDALSPD